MVQSRCLCDRKWGDLRIEIPRERRGPAATKVFLQQVDEFSGDKISDHVICGPEEPVRAFAA